MAAVVYRGGRWLLRRATGHFYHRPAPAGISCPYFLLLACRTGIARHYFGSERRSHWQQNNARRQEVSPPNTHYHLTYIQSTRRRCSPTRSALIPPQKRPRLPSQFLCTSMSPESAMWSAISETHVLITVQILTLPFLLASSFSPVASCRAPVQRTFPSTPSVHVRVQVAQSLI